MSYRERKVNSNGTYSQYVHQTGSDVQQPVDIQSRYQQTVQTHNAVSVAASGGSVSTWIDTNGFDKIALAVLNSASTSFTVNMDWSNDGTTLHASEVILPAAAASSRTIITETKARYARVYLFNGNTVANTMSAWVYLKA